MNLKPPNFFGIIFILLSFINCLDGLAVADLVSRGNDGLTGSHGSKPTGALFCPVVWVIFTFTSLRFHFHHTAVQCSSGCDHGTFHSGR